MSKLKILAGVVIAGMWIFKGLIEAVFFMLTALGTVATIVWGIRCLAH